MEIKGLILLTVFYIELDSNRSDINEFSTTCCCASHNFVCSGCIKQVETFQTIRDILTEIDDKWLLHKFDIAVRDVNEYKKHIVRAIHQDRAKKDIYDKLSEKEALLIFDYAMKFLPQRFREKQSDFFAKKGNTSLKYKYI